MRPAFYLVALCCLSQSAMAAKSQSEPKLLTHITPLPKALSPDFAFRKTKLYQMTETPPQTKQKGGRNGGKTGDFTSSKAPSAVQDAAITFERQYRLFGAVTKLDQHQRFGNYFDFFWRAKRSADLTVRLEYRQEKLHAHIQAQEVPYNNAQGNHKTEFKVIGDEYFDGGRVIAWRCLLIENQRIVAEDRSFLWN
jgi:hypothetical protein